jgi:hypothetical protein
MQRLHFYLIRVALVSFVRSNVFFSGGNIGLSRRDKLLRSNRLFNSRSATATEPGVWCNLLTAMSKFLRRNSNGVKSYLKKLKGFRYFPIKSTQNPPPLFRENES